eukprot:gene653-4205_t
MLTVEFRDPLPPAPVVLLLNFSAALRPSSGRSYPADRGFYRIPVNGSAGGDGYRGKAKGGRARDQDALWAVEARTEFPCFDEPALKAPFSVTLFAEGGVGVDSNMPLAGCEAAGAGTATRVSKGGVPVRLVTLPGAASRATADLTLTVGAGVLD